jgi:chloramphenicol O-acetyltransferase type A
MTYHVIDMRSFPRKAHFSYFSAMANPYVGVTVPVDITRLHAWCRSSGAPFFLTLLHTVSGAANDVAELRQRIADGGIVQFDHCDTSHTVLHDDGTYSYCNLDCAQPLAAFLPQAAAAHEYAKTHPTLEDGEDALGLLFISCLPWLPYTALVQPTPVPADSNPRITWGQYTRQDDRISLPVTLLAHHALVDGIHIGRFYDSLRDRLSSF